MTAAKQKLIIVESPAKARTISKFLGKGYKVEASQGHVCDLPKSQIGVDVDNDFALKYITIRGRGEILNRIRKEARTASQIYLATDPDREGEAISWHLSHVLNMDPSQPCRIEFHEVTKKAIQNALKSARPVDMGRVDAQQARRVLDRLVGYKISPLLWAKIKKGLSAGRNAHGEVFLRTRDERFALLVRRLGMGKAARLLLFAGAGKPALVLGDEAVDKFLFDAVGRADDGAAVAVQLQGHRTALGANQRIARHSPI